MPVSRRAQICSKATSVLCLVGLLTSTVVAQTPTPAGDAQNKPAQAQATMQTPSKPVDGPLPNIDYSKERPFWKLGPYTGRSVPPANTTNTPRIDQLMRNGTVYLSLSDAIAMALENNLDIAIARYNLDLAETDVLRVKSGGSARGVNTGVISGTPGGSGTGVTSGSGSGTGGTTTGTGGAGTGSSGIVTSTSGVGSALDSYDPVITGKIQFERTTVQAVPSSSLPFGTTYTTNSNLANFAFTQAWTSGTAMNVTFNNARISSSLWTTTPVALEPAMNVTLRQHLLSGLSLENNKRFIIQARNNQQITNLSFKQQIISTVSQIQNIYWDLVNAYEDVKVKQRSLEYANRTLSDNRKQVEIGTLAPIEIVRAQSSVASSTQDLIVSQTNLQYQQLIMKNAITKNMRDPMLANAPVIPTDTLSVSDTPLRPVEDLVADALKNRPDLQESDIDLKTRALTRRTARHAMLPTLDLLGFYGANPVNRNYGDAFGDLFNSTAPDKGVAVQLNVPLRNRSAQADQARAELEYRQAELSAQQLRNQVGISVRNAAYAVTQNRARVEAARAARDLAQQSLDAEQKKFALGASTSYLVLQFQRDLTQSEVNLVTAMTAYEKSRVSLDQVTATTLDNNGIVLAQALAGSVTNQPTVPGVAPAPQQTIDSTQQIQKQMNMTPDEQIQRLRQQMQQPQMPQQQK